MRPVPVIHVITKLEFGGAQQNTLHTVANLDRRRFQPVLMAGPDGYLMPQARHLDVPLGIVPSMERPLNPVADLRAYRELVDLLTPLGRQRAIVHTHSSKAGILGRWAARKAGIPVIIHSIHGFGFTPEQGFMEYRLLRGAERITSRITDHFIAVSEANRKDGIRYGLFGPDECTVIRSGFDLQRFRSAPAHEERLAVEAGLPPGCPVVLMVACLKPQKAPLDFVRMAAQVHPRMPGTRFLIAGDGELRGALEEEIKRLGLAGILVPLGWREDVPELIKSSRVVVLTSRWEGLPRVIPQAKAAGRPVVATAVDGSVEAIREGVDGFLCPPGDVKALADRVLALLADGELAETMGREGARTVDEFDENTMVRRQEELYGRLLEEKGLW
ncbi:MAG: glycosyltransferase family 4 protein [bacterium]|nr:MAG: glycosyltransferase family 4 protein [bacterium]